MKEEVDLQRAALAAVRQELELATVEASRRDTTIETLQQQLRQAAEENSKLQQELRQQAAQSRSASSPNSTDVAKPKVRQGCTLL